MTACDYERHFFVISRPEDVAFLADGTLLICSHYTDVVLKFNSSSGAWTWPITSVEHTLMWCILGNRNNGRFQLEKMHVQSFHFHENFLGFVIGGSVTKRGRERWLKSPKLDIFCGSLTPEHFFCTVGEKLGVFARVEKPVGLTVGSDG